MHFKIKDSKLGDQLPQMPIGNWETLNNSPTYMALDILFIISATVIMAVQVFCVAIATRDMLNDRFNATTQLISCFDFLLILGGLIFIQRFFWAHVGRTVFKHPTDSPPNS